MSKVLMVASEAVPFVKSGGLADVIGALPRALVEQGDEVAVVLPRYGSIPLAGAARVADGLTVWFGPDAYPTEIYAVVENGVPFFLVDCPALYDRPGIYFDDGVDFPDNHVRFALLCRSALNVIRYVYRPRIVHCHDWQGALMAPYVRHSFSGDPTYMGMKTVLTIHNLAYQGRFGPEALGQIGLGQSLFDDGIIEAEGDVNFLKAGIQLADAITTVSPGYAREIQTPEFGCGLDEFLRDRGGALTGILNGVDYSHWDPETDPLIAANYSSRDLSGKRKCKADLLQEFGLPDDDLDLPVLGVVTRFTSQKGCDLIEAISDELAAADLYLVALGTGEPRYEKLFTRLASEHPGRIAVRVAYDNVLAHKIEAGADMFLMPSRYEPCGLNQIYSLRYGTVPIVRATGGLDGTINAATGFKFEEYSGEALLDAVHEALQAYANSGLWRKMMLSGMAQDFSWTVSAGEYSSLYRELLA